MPRAAVVVVVVVLATAGSARAQPGLTAPVPAPAPAPTSQRSEAELGEGTALALSLGGTAAAWGLIVASANSQDDSTSEMLATVGVFGTFFAPSFGHWYAHSFGTRGMAIRALSTGGMVLGAMIELSECPLFEADEHCSSGAGPALIIAGFIGYLGGTLDDIITAPRKARAYNQRHRELAIVPVVHSNTGGISLVGRF